MTDPRLNSVHLELPRREEFRRARSELFNSCGKNTLQPDPPRDEASAGGSRTAIQNLEGSIPAGVNYVLIDREMIYPLKVGLNTIGRLQDNDVVVEDPYVSRRHCAVVVHSTTTCELYDVASKNGTYLNGRRLACPTPLASGDEIRMCNRQLVFVTKADCQSLSGHAGTQPD